MTEGFEVPDEKKRLKLAGVGFRLIKTCATCIHADFGETDWGSCMLHKYEHEKHKRTHQIPAHKFGFCRGYEQDVYDVGRLGDYAYLMDP